MNSIYHVERIDNRCIRIFSNRRLYSSVKAIIEGARGRLRSRTPCRMEECYDVGTISGMGFSAALRSGPAVRRRKLVLRVNNELEAIPQITLSNRERTVLCPRQRDQVTKRIGQFLP